ncbi:cysteinyl-trna synthetase [Holotrichia oblita]|nr:cysteinyl-trna synthetase [Holotrichia oblita]
MINKANELGITVKQLADEYIAEYFKDAKGLGIQEADVHPKATENIDSIIELIKTLIDKGYAYNVNGDVYFSTKKFEDYGKLSHQPLEDLEIGARIDISEQKQDPTDFAVWKKQKEGEPAWQSPWGMGRPGWHIECSAMANKYLGKTIDIHSGGKDLIFPHHENEIAQSEAANGTEFARYWLHNGYINVDNKKMSKSLGNFFTVRDVAEEFDYEVIRFFMLSSHYRSPISFSKDLMEASKSALDRIYTCIKNLEFLLESSEPSKTGIEENEYIKKLIELKQKFIDAMDDDLNTADAIAAIFEVVSEANKYAAQPEIEAQSIQYTIDLINELIGILGLLNRRNNDAIPAEVEQLIDERLTARKNKDWAKSDEIRDTLKNMGYAVEDTPQGTKVTIYP